MCAGCPTGIFTKMLTRLSDDYEIVAGNATGCLEVASSIFPYSALRRREPTGAIVDKPALRAFRTTALRLERCRAKASVATRCARPLR